MSISDKIANWIPYLESPLAIKILSSVIIIIFFWLLKFIFHKIIQKNLTDAKAKYNWRKVSSYLLVFITILIVGRIWTQGVQSVATYFGLLTAGVAIALKDVIANLAGWVFIISRRPFEVGDRIQIEENAGDVIDLSLFQFSVLEIGNWAGSDQSTGRIIHIPNGKIFTCSLANYDKGFKYIWNEISIVITFESDWKKAKKILQDISSKRPENLSKKVESQIKKAAQKFMIIYKNLTPIVYTNVVAYGVELTIRYLCETRKRRDTQQEIWEDVLSEFAKHKDIDLAYPTTRFYDNLGEGKKI